MFARIQAALQARRAAILEAEPLVYRFGSRGVAMAQTYAQDQSVSEERRDHYRRVARVAERRHLGIKGLDIATQYYEMARWQRRRGNLIGGGHPVIEKHLLQAPRSKRSRPELEGYGIGFTDFSAAVILALVTAKVVVVFDRVSFGARTGLAEVVLRTGLYTVAAFVLLVIEHALSTRHEAGGFVQALVGAYRHPDMPRIWATLICVGLAFAGYAAFAVNRREIGTARLTEAFLAPPRRGHPERAGDG